MLLQTCTTSVENKRRYFEYYHLSMVTKAIWLPTFFKISSENHTSLESHEAK